jgi:hypothetical protein
MDSGQGRDLAPIFGDLSQSEILSEVKPPLCICHDQTWSIHTISIFSEMAVLESGIYPDLKRKGLYNYFFIFRHFFLLD